MKKILLLLTMFFIFMLLPTGCSAEEASLLDPNNPVEIRLWHYYTGALLNAFDMMVLEFNETVGVERGIFVEAISFGNMGGVESNIHGSALGEAGAMPLPNIFSSFPDTAYLPQRLGLLVDLDDYITQAQLDEYFAPFVERGRMGANNALRIFPVAMSAEVMMLNETDWHIFASENGFTYDNLQTMEGLASVAQAYYHWSGGQAFWGRDAMANMFIIGSKMFGTEIFEVHKVDGEFLATININEQAMRRFWDYYYTPFVSGYFAADANFRTDDLRVGDLLAFVGSTASAAFFPEDVTIDGTTRAIQSSVLPPPSFADATNVIVKQGAGKVVMLSTPEEEYASVVFLRWLTEPTQNLHFSAASGRLPVRVEAMDADLVRAAAEDVGISLTDVTYQTLHVAIEAIQTSELYSTGAFVGAVEARAILTHSLRNEARAARAYVLELIAADVSREDAIAQYTTDEKFYAWMESLSEALVSAVTVN
ncbi:MAG: extracellular solute-binding protein [Defluviitaleaceae bacterium]|nr:extracellular solute-binding protein [Defluviitaleaceae bacterium]